MLIPRAEMVDTAAERARLEKERETALKELARLEGKLSNAEFMSKAPKKIVDAELEKKEKYTKLLESITNAINNL